MDKASDLGVAAPSRRRVQIAALVVAGLIVTSTGVWWLFVRDGRQALTLSAFNHFDGTGYSFVFDDLEPVPCDDIDGCVESLAGAHVDLYRFSDQRTAQTFTLTEVNTQRSDWIVMVFIDQDLRARERDGAFDLLDDTWNAQ